MSDPVQSRCDGVELSGAPRSRGLCIVLCGVDGCGKSTAGALLDERLKSLFAAEKIQRFHWKPPVFSTARRAARGPIKDPHGQSVRSPIASLAFFAVHWTEFFLGSLFAIRRIKRQGGLVLIDRFYYDFFVDQRRYRLNVAQSIVRLGYTLLSKPELAFLLDAPVEMLRQRKQEVALEETARQRAAFLQLFKRLPNGVIVDASQAPEKVADDITAAVRNFLAAGTLPRRGSNSESLPR
jgi:thymidylate kinase